jgi:hypothetical protein
MILLLNLIGITKLRPDVCLYTKLSGSPLSMIFGSLLSLTECWQIVRKTSTINHQPLIRIKNQHTHPMR